MSPRYTPIEPLIAERVLRRLQAHWPNGKTLTVRKAGALTTDEQDLPDGLCDELRAALDFGGRASLYVRLSSSEAVVAKQTAATVKRLAERGHSPRAIADATGASEATARAAGAVGKRAPAEPNEAALWVGLAAVRQYHAVQQSLLAGRLGWSQVRLSQLERRQSSPDAQDVGRYLEALAVVLRVSPTRLRRRAIEAGAAVIDTGVPDGPAVHEDPTA